ncbi:MAG: hypothetical protein ABJC79_05460, partial [Acidimicrobiia bacterium]
MSLDCAARGWVVVGALNQPRNESSADAGAAPVTAMVDSDPTSTTAIRRAAAGTSRSASRTSREPEWFRRPPP